ncbi:hypothetical protein OH966_003899 [Vibrio parahaemolyticus]|uniref:hypothetical protein n=1 Tax=Vibrio parahaemolyticus TaxID=670 RepID=UPI00114CC53A|nr:hypothetical protein [Vibrio parahaemolyticus]EGQ8307309.1 hypothetical protein [Vibrio parahaemolyticus]EGQ8808386.1 hypothetical protein [Vibrio parahaemolyticus]EGQ8892174.1 hypothetical protein [Vibrio parahaemolyticus]EGQ8946418.1 hypothetical protein [Vibrio parahaemolyticus]EGQ8966653.1 hypothetical protein [Vibrio parahaemolyticus]
MALMIPVKHPQRVSGHQISLIPLAHFCCDVAQARFSARIPYLTAFAKWVKDSVRCGAGSLYTISAYYYRLKTYIYFCDCQGIDPFSEAGYFRYLGTDGELWRQVRLYKPERYLFEYEDGQELGVKEGTARSISKDLNTVLCACGFDTNELRNQCRKFETGFKESTILPYHPNEQKITVGRLTDAFFVLASELIAAKTNNSELPETIKVPIDNNHVSYQSDHTKLPRCLGSNSINHKAAFNQCMGMAYYLICYYTSLNDSVIRGISHPLKIESDKIDKSLKTITVSGYKKRAYKSVDGVFSNEDDVIDFDVDKRNGYEFMSVLIELSLLYSDRSDSRLLYELDTNGKVSSSFHLSQLNQAISADLNLLSHKRGAAVDWLIECFLALVEKQMMYTLSTVKNNKGRIVVSRKLEKASKHSITWRCQSYAFAIISCFTDVPIKNIVLPLTYHAKDKQGDIKVEFSYVSGSVNSFTVPAKYMSFFKALESWASSRAKLSTATKYLIPFGGGTCAKTFQWEGVSPLTYKALSNIGLGYGSFYADLNSSKFRKTTSDEEYSDTNISHALHVLQNTRETLEKHYTNGDPKLNSLIISQAIKVLQRVASGSSLDRAKQEVCDELNIEMLAHDEWLERKEASNPNGLICNGKQDLIRDKKRQRETNKRLGADLPCSEFDQCYLCKSAKGIDEPNSVYKLLSFVDVLKEALDRYPDAKSAVKEKIAAFEKVLLGASDAVYEEALARFNAHGRHPRVSIEHIKASKGVL